MSWTTWTGSPFSAGWTISTAQRDKTREKAITSQFIGWAVRKRFVLMGKVIQEVGEKAGTGLLTHK